MLESGLLDEVAALVGRLGRAASHAVGYKELLPVVTGDAMLGDGRSAAIAATRALTKRQRTWFRRDPRIVWLPWHHDTGALAELAWSELMKGQQWSS